MADFKQQVHKHLHSARQWLARAEESFGKDRKVRGELDLLLAQAELQHARETSIAGQWRYKFPLLRHSAAFVLAACVIVSGFGGAFLLATWREAAVPIPVTLDHSSGPAVQLNAEPIGVRRPLEAPAPDPSPAAAAAPVVRSYTAPVADKENSPMGVSAPRDVAVSPDDLQKLVRAAGKSLRGQ